MKLFSRDRTNRRVSLRERGTRFARLRRAAGRVFAAAAGVGVIVGAWWWLTRTDVFALRNIAIEGTTAERAEEIRGLLNLKTPDGTAGGGTGFTSLLFLDLAQTRAQVESHPWVAKAFVKRELPDTLRVVVQEREPKLVLALDRLYYVDASGTPFKALAPGDRSDLPVLTGLTRDDVLSHGPAAKEAIAGAIELVDAIAVAPKGSLALEDVGEIGFDDRRGYSVLTVKGNERINFGVGDYAGKLARLKEVRDARKGEPLRNVDLSWASRVVVSR